MSDSVGECESHSQLMSKFVILNKGVIDKVSNCRRQEGNEGGWDRQTDGRTHRIVNSTNTNAVLGSVAVHKPNMGCICFTIAKCTRSQFLP